MKVVVDTNVIVSALMNTHGVPARILSMILEKELTILHDNRVIFEYIDVLFREKFGFNDEIISGTINFFRHDGEFVNAIFSNKNFKDETDKKFYEVYKSGNADFLITGNKKHFPNEKGIVTPKEFLELLHK